MFETFVLALIGLLTICTAAVLLGTLAMKAWRLAAQGEPVRWGYCFKQAGLGLVVALFATPKLGIAGALLVGWLTPLTVGFAWVVFERVAPQPQRQAVRVKR